LSTSLYLIAGGLGVPLFAGGAIAGPTGGYLLGFVLAAGVVGLWMERAWANHPIAIGVGLLLGNATIYLVGLPWLAWFVGVRRALPLGLYPFLVGDLLKITAVAGVLSWVQRRRQMDQVDQVSS
jgi:biotin transport system substrate-specific component